MLSLIQSIFGYYTPVTYPVVEKVWDPVNEVFETVTYDAVAAGAAGVDWPYIAGVALFALTLYCICRIVGSVISHV